MTRTMPAPDDDKKAPSPPKRLQDWTAGCDVRLRSTDLIVERASRYAMELAQFTHSERRQTIAMMNGLRGAIRDTDTAETAQLAGHLVLIGFDSPRGLPPGHVDQAAIASSVAKVLGVHVAGSVSLSGGNLRDGFQVSVTNNPLREGNVAVFPIASVPDTEPGRKHRFEIAASYTTATTVKDTEEELVRVVAAHDRAGNDLLLLSAGAPSASGLCPLADEVAVEPQLLRRYCSKSARTVSGSTRSPIGAHGRGAIDA